MTAAAMNRLDGGTRPESGYRVEYALLPLSTGEQQQLERETLALYDRGLIPAEVAVARIMGTTPDAARAQLDQARRAGTLSTSSPTAEEAEQ
jgi:hypothetical protein